MPGYMLSTVEVAALADGHFTPTLSPAANPDTRWAPGVCDSGRAENKEETQLLPGHTQGTLG